VKLATRLIVEEALESVLAGRAASPANAAVTATPTHGRCAGRDFPVGAARTRTGIRLSSATAGRAIPAITTGAAGGAATAPAAAVAAEAAGTAARLRRRRDGTYVAACRTGRCDRIAAERRCTAARPPAAVAANSAGRPAAAGAATTTVAAIAAGAADGAGRFDLCPPLRAGADRLPGASLGSRLPFATAAARANKARRASGAVDPVRAIGADLGIRPGIRRPRADEGDE
jgi:hypothetical protein